MRAALALAVTVACLARVCVRVRASVCAQLCACRADRGPEYRGELVDCSYAAPALFTLDEPLPAMVHTLDLSSNNLSEVSHLKLYRSSSMKELILRNNRISRIEIDDFRLPQLLKLDLSDNRLEFIFGDMFKSMKNLEYLNLANNRFTNFPTLAFHHLAELKTIVLDDNDVGASLRNVNLFHRSGYGLTNKIKEISIRGINLNVVPDNFLISAYQIEKLDISDNNLKDIFEINFSIQYLDLSDNPIEELSPEDFASLPALRELKLNNLAIKEVPDFVFEDLRGLKKLELERNRNLTELSGLCFGRDVLEDADDFGLEELSLAGSRLARLAAGLARPLGRLARLDLQGNPWRCDCDLLWLKTLQIPPRDYQHLRCGSPRPLRGARVFELDDSYFVCGAQRHYTALCVAAAAFCALLAAIAVWFFVVIPRCQSRGVELRSVYMPAAAYTVLPVTANTHL